MFANCQLSGMSFAFPDVCLTPAPPAPAPVPIPYPDIAATPMTVKAVYNVLIMGGPAHNMMSTVPLTNGDNPGIATGVVSHTVMGSSRHITAAFTVIIGAAPATRLTSISIQNSINAPGCQIVPSQIKLLLLAP